MISEKRLAANRRNAQRSTGPRTLAGKLVSRQNSLKHGLTGQGDVVGDDLAEAVAAKEKAFVACAHPANEMEHAFIHRMALAAVRMELTERTDAARRQERKLRVARRFERSLIGSAMLGARLLAEDPAEGLKELEATSVGCQWAIGQWQVLEQKVASDNCWSVRDLTQAFALVGLRAGEAHASCKTALSLRMVYLVFQPEIDYAEADRLLVLDTSAYTEQARVAAYAEVLPSREVALGALRNIVAGEVARLEQLRDEVAAEVEQPEVKNRLSRVSIDSSPEGMRLARYDAMNELAFHRNWNAFHRLRKLGANELGLAPAEVPPLSAQNEPTQPRISLEVTPSYGSPYPSAGTLFDPAREAVEIPAAPATVAAMPLEALEVPPAGVPAVALSA